jgi:predicted O-methyltransferase YrrM
MRSAPATEPTDSLRPNRARYVARVVRSFAAAPGEGVEKLRERTAATAERVRSRGRKPSYLRTPEWERRLHESLAVAWPCACTEEFDDVWAGVVETMTTKGFRIGRRNYGGDDDCDRGLARSLFCLTRHLSPHNVVETGVAHGVSSRCILEGLERNDRGSLWSIDLPPLTIPERRAEIGVAVTDGLRHRWHYLEGSSRRVLPPLLDHLGTIELFVHDSWHSTRNTRWELDTAWLALARRGAVASDDIDHNYGFARFERDMAPTAVFHATADDGERLFGIAVAAGRPDATS